jgi:hypothetical protein
VDPVVLPSGAAELRLRGATLKLEADLTLKIKVNDATFAEGAYSNFRLEVSMTDAVTGNVRTVVIDENSKYDVSGAAKMYYFTGISPKQMGDVITLDLYGTFAGQEYCKSMTYTLSTYCYNQIGGNNAKLRRLLADLLNFGAAHQKYTGYNTENLVNAAMTDAQKGYASSGELTLEDKLNVKYAVLEGATASFRGATLSLTNKVEIQYVVYVTDLTDVSLHLTTGSTTYVVDASKFVPRAGYANQYYVYFDQLQANQMRAEVISTVYRGDTAISNSALYSIESYAASNINVAKLNEILKCMMYYGDSAKAYTG